MADIVNHSHEMSHLNALGRDFYMQDTVNVARELLGSLFVRVLPDGEVLSAVITETEAYLATDEASHSYRGENRRNKSMFMRGGTLYVYLIYGVHHCINVVTRSAGVGEAVLIRAGKPEDGIATMMKNRNYTIEKKLLSGPGNFARAFGFGLQDDGSDLCSPSLYITRKYTIPNDAIFSSERIGISKGKEYLYRYYIIEKIGV